MRVYAIDPRPLLVHAALRCGIDVIPVLRRPDPHLQVPALTPETVDVQGIAKAVAAHEASSTPSSAICIGPTDDSCLVAAQVNDIVGLRLEGFFLARSLAHMSDKAITRTDVDRSCGALNPEWTIARGPQEICDFQRTYGVDVVVKPQHGSGSRGVLILSEMMRTAEISDVVDCPALVESRVRGQEYSVETMSWRGDHTLLAITRKTTGGRSGVVEVQQQQPANIDGRTRTTIAGAVGQVLDAVGYTHGLAHTEVIVDGQDVKLVETHGRAGGDYIVDMLHWTIGVDAYTVLFQTMARGVVPDIRSSGLEARALFPDLSSSPYSRGHIARSLYAVPAVRELVFLLPEHLWGPMDDSGDRHCAVLAAGSGEELEELARVIADVEGVPVDRQDGEAPR